MAYFFHIGHQQPLPAASNLRAAAATAATAAEAAAKISVGILHFAFLHLFWVVVAMR